MKKAIFAAIIVAGLVILGVVGHRSFKRIFPDGSRIVTAEEARIVDCYRSETGWDMDQRFPGILSRNCDEWDLSEIVIFKNF